MEQIISSHSSVYKQLTTIEHSNKAFDLDDY